MRICIIACFMPPREQWNFSAREVYERFESEPSLPHASCVDLCRVLSCLINRISARTVITSSTVAHPQPCNSPWFDIFRRKSISRHCAVSLYETLLWEIHKLNPLSFNYACAKLKKLLTVILCYYQLLGMLTYLLLNIYIEKLKVIFEIICYQEFVFNMY